MRGGLLLLFTAILLVVIGFVNYCLLRRRYVENRLAAELTRLVGQGRVDAQPFGHDDFRGGIALRRADATVFVEFPRRGGLRLRVALDDRQRPELPSGPLPLLVLRGERPLDRLGKRLRINSETQTDDPEFDRQVYVAGDQLSPEIAEILGAPQLRRATLRLLSRGCYEIATETVTPFEARLSPWLATTSPLVAVYSPLPGREDPADLFAVVDDLVELARCFPDKYNNSEHPPDHVFAWMATSALTVILILAPLSRMIHVTYRGGPSPWRLAFLISLAVTIPAVIVTGWRLRGRPDAIGETCLLAFVWLSGAAMIVSSIMYVLGPDGS